MADTKTSNQKKDVLIQLRVEKSFADQLNSLAERRQLPLSVLLRTWISEKLRDESKAELKDRAVWIEQSFAKMSLESFDSGPLLLLYAFPVSGKAKLSVDTLKQYAYALVPGYGHRRYVQSQIVQNGLEVTVRGGDGDSLLARGEGHKSGEIEAVLTVPSTESKQIFAQQLDYLIVTAVQSLCSIYRAHGIELAYVIHISLLNAKGFAPVQHEILASSEPLPKFSSDRIDLPEITITSFEQLASMAATGEYLIDSLDEIAHAASTPGSMSFDRQNKWINPVH